MDDLGEPIYDSGDYHQVLEEKEQLEVRLRDAEAEIVKSRRQAFDHLREVEAERDEHWAAFAVRLGVGLEHDAAIYWQQRAEKAEAECKQMTDNWIFQRNHVIELEDCIVKMVAERKELEKRLREGLVGPEY